MTGDTKLLFDVAGLGHDVDADHVPAPIEAPGPLQCEAIQDGGSLIVTDEDNADAHVKSDYFMRVQE